jgi:hypothetical protein
VIFDTPNEAKRALHGMMGLNVDKSVLLTKKPSGILLMGHEGEGNRDDEVFQSLIEDRPTPCLVIRNLIAMEEITSRMDYKDFEFDVKDEMDKYGECRKVIAPRPPMFGDPASTPGHGKVFVQFSVTEEAEKAKK